jgi:hypothetical protein
MVIGTEQYSAELSAKRRVLSLGRVKPVQAKTSEIRTLVGADTVFKFPATGGGPIAFAAQGGPVLVPSIKPIFWGAEWGRAAPPLSSTVILNAIAAIVSGPYLNSLGQYGIGGTPSVLDPMFVLDSEPPLTPTLSQITSATTTLLNRLIDDEQLAEPDENWSQFNVVFLASTVVYPSDSTGTYTGAHSTFQWSDYDLGDTDDDPVRYAWIGTQAFGGISALDMTTSTFSHELVEAMTDPGPTGGWRQSPDPGGTGGEIGDVCGQIGRLDGVAVQAYWSNADNQCVIPTRSHSARIGPPDVAETSTTNGPDQIVNIDRDCGRSAHWTGTYHYHVINHSLTITLTASTKGYTDPTGSWKVAGLNVKPGESPTISPKLSVSFPGLPEDASAIQPVTLRLVATETTLQLSNDAVDGTYDVPVSYTATERSDNLSTHISASGWATSVTVEGQTVQVPDDFNAAQAKCIQGQAASIEIHMKDLHDLIAEFNKFVQTHQGPPINQEIAGSLGQASLNLATQLLAPQQRMQR